jgi:hypothetical protein
MPSPDQRSNVPRRSQSASPAERGAQFAAHQQQLKEEAAERRKRAAEAPPRTPKPHRKASRG